MTIPKDYKLKPRQQAFADYYIETGNVSESAVRAGYSKSYARTQAYQFLDHPRIGIYIREKMAEHAARGIADQTEILETLTDVIRGKKNGAGYLGIGPGKQKVTDVPPTVSEKVRAAELLGKRFLMWTDKQIVEEIKPTLVEDIPEDDS